MSAVSEIEEWDPEDNLPIADLSEKSIRKRIENE